MEELNKEELQGCWGDDMTLGWIYQYWNDLERERLDAKINDGGKIEPHEIASKTQMFTERYMVYWMLQNSLGPILTGHREGIASALAADSPGHPGHRRLQASVASIESGGHEDPSCSFPQHLSAAAAIAAATGR